MALQYEGLGPITAPPKQLALSGHVRQLAGPVLTSSIYSIPCLQGEHSPLLRNASPGRQLLKERVVDKSRELPFWFWNWITSGSVESNKSTAPIFNLRLVPGYPIVTRPVTLKIPFSEYTSLWSVAIGA